MCWKKTTLFKSTSIDPNIDSSDVRRSTIMERKSQDPEILIIGAGAAGIACATRLIELGFRKIMILEAEKRIGGRIHTIPFADNVIDLGAQWCHGQKNNIVYNIVKDRDLLDTCADLFIDYQCIRSNGEIVPDETADLLKNTLADIFVNMDEDSTQSHISLGKYISKEFKSALQQPELKHIDSTIAAEFLESIKKIESSGADIDEISTRGFNEFWECEGDYLLNWKDKGFSEFLQILTKADILGNEHGILDSRIITGMKVERIEWDRADGMVHVKCENFYEIFEVDHVVITTSLGVLKESADTMFVPPLPEEKQEVIKHLGYGSVGKIFIEFPNKFWPDDWTGFSTLWRQHELADLYNSPHAWLQSVIGFFCVSYQPRVLVGWFVSNQMADIESLTKENVQDSCMFLLKKFLTNWEIPAPVQIEVTRWYTNPHFRGSYSFRSVQIEENETDIRVLGQPLTILAHALLEDMSPISGESLESLQPLTVKPVLQFAGEATSVHYYSTVHGAVESGLREASRLASYYSKENF